MDANERATLIKRYKEGHRAVMDAFRGIADEELDRSSSGEWRIACRSPQQRIA